MMQTVHNDMLMEKFNLSPLVNTLSQCYGPGIPRARSTAQSENTGEMSWERGRRVLKQYCV